MSEIFEKYNLEKVNKYKKLKDGIIKKCIADGLMVVNSNDDEYKMLKTNKDIIEELNHIGLNIIEIKKKCLFQWTKHYDYLNYNIVVYIDEVGVNMKKILKQNKIIKEYKVKTNK